MAAIIVRKHKSAPSERSYIVLYIEKKSLLKLTFFFSVYYI